MPKRTINIVADKPNINNRIYPREVLHNALKEAVENGFNILIEYSQDSRPVGVINGFEIDENGVVTIDYDISDPIILELLQEAEKNTIGIHTSGVGSLSGNVINKGFEFTHCFIANEADNMMLFPTTVPIEELRDTKK